MLTMRNLLRKLISVLQAKCVASTHHTMRSTRYLGFFHSSSQKLRKFWKRRIHFCANTQRHSTTTHKTPSNKWLTRDALVVNLTKRNRLFARSKPVPSHTNKVLQMMMTKIIVTQTKSSKIIIALRTLHLSCPGTNRPPCHEEHGNDSRIQRRTSKDCVLILSLFHPRIIRREAKVNVRLKMKQ